MTTTHEQVIQAAQDAADWVIDKHVGTSVEIDAVEAASEEWTRAAAELELPAKDRAAFVAAFSRRLRKRNSDSAMNLVESASLNRLDPMARPTASGSAFAADPKRHYLGYELVSVGPFLGRDDFEPKNDPGGRHDSFWEFLFAEGAGLFGEAFEILDAGDMPEWADAAAELGRAEKAHIITSGKVTRYERIYAETFALALADWCHRGRENVAEHLADPMRMVRGLATCPVIWDSVDWSDGSPKEGRGTVCMGDLAYIPRQVDDAELQAALSWLMGVQTAHHLASFRRDPIGVDHEFFSFEVPGHKYLRNWGNDAISRVLGSALHIPLWKLARDIVDSKSLGELVKRWPHVALTDLLWRVTNVVDLWNESCCDASVVAKGLVTQVKHGFESRRGSEIERARARAEYRVAKEKSRRDAFDAGMQAQIKKMVDDEESALEPMMSEAAE